MAVTFAEEQATETKKDKRGIYGGYGTYGYSSYAAPISQAVSVVTKEVPVPVPHPVAVPVEKHVPVPVKVNIVLPFHAKKKKWKKHDYEIFTIARAGKSLVKSKKRKGEKEEKEYTKSRTRCSTETMFPNRFAYTVGLTYWCATFVSVSRRSAQTRTSSSQSRSVYPGISIRVIGSKRLHHRTLINVSMWTSGAIS